MYNGIGLHTPRGSATSGHITKNLSHVKRKYESTQSCKSIDDIEKVKSVSTDILDHNKKRIIDAKIFELEELMIEQGYSDDEIQLALTKKRKQVQDESDRTLPTTSKYISTDSHEISVTKSKNNERFRQALKLDKKT